MNPDALHATTLDLFCRVVDNFGDIGICWRLARQLQREHGLAVTLWVDDLVSFHRLCSEVNIDLARQQIEQVEIRHWRNQDLPFAPDALADIVIEFFGCEIPPAYITAMAELMRTSGRAPVWLNLEGLSAEEWVEGCHSLPSPHPRLPLTKYFFFPGFTAKTGGLLIEADVALQRAQFQEDPGLRAQFLAALGVPRDAQGGMFVSMFCYPQAPLSSLFAAWRDGAEPVTCLVPEGVAVATVQAFLGQAAAAGAARTLGMLTVRVVPFVGQREYDRLLWSCDLNFVRGEDSFVRAQLAARPFVWHIYPQDKDLHHVKLRAFLQRYAPALDTLQWISLAWNSAVPEQSDRPPDWPASWARLREDWPTLTENALDWDASLLQNGDLAANLVKFAERHRSEAHQNRV